MGKELFLQFELWKDCRHGCAFCFNKHIMPVRDKIASIQYAINAIRDVRRNMDSLSFMGGEFFDGQLTPDVKKEFNRLTDLVLKLMRKGRIGRSMICASLMYEKPDDLLEYLDRYEHAKMLDRLLICTSWDTIGRFSKETEACWNASLYGIRRFYPQARLHVEMILTQDLINKVLSGELSIKGFEKNWNCRVDFNTPYLPFHSPLGNKAEFDKAMPGFFPRRKDFFEFLKKCHKDGEGHLDSMLSCENHSTVLHYTLDDKVWIILPDRHSIGHTCTNLQECKNDCCGYLDSPVRMHHDVREFVELSGGI